MPRSSGEPSIQYLGFSVVRQETERWGEAIATARIRLE
jgi:hypothetical protein